MLSHIVLRYPLLSYYAGSTAVGVSRPYFWQASWQRFSGWCTHTCTCAVRALAYVYTRVCMHAVLCLLPCMLMYAVCLRTNVFTTTSHGDSCQHAPAPACLLGVSGCLRLHVPLQLAITATFPHIPAVSPALANDGLICVNSNLYMVSLVPLRSLHSSLRLERCATRYGAR